MKLVSRMLPFLIIVIALVFPSQVEAQVTGTLEGTVSDFRSEPMEGAVIRIDIDGELLEVTTDLDGSYSIELPEGSHEVTLVVQRQPLTSVEVDIVARQSREGNFDLGAMNDEDQARALEMLEERGDAEAVRASFDLGRAALAAGNLDEAVEQFSIAVENDDQHLILANLAQALAQSGRHGEAAENYRLALVQDPENSVYLQNLGIALGNDGDVAGATESITRATTLDPLSAGPAFFNLGIIFLNRAQMNEAIDAFNESIAADESNAQAHYQLGLALVGTNPADAVAPFERFLEIAPDDPNASVAQGLLDFARTQ